MSILKHLSHLLKLVVELLNAEPSLHFCALSTMNHILDLCITRYVYHPWGYDDCSLPPIGHRREQYLRASSHDVPKDAPEVHGNTTLFSTAEPLQAHFEPLIHSMHGGRTSIPGLTKTKMCNWRMKSVDSPMLTHRQIPSTSESASSDQVSKEAENESGPTDSERTPLEVLMRMNPKQIVEILKSSTETHRKAMGTRHRCTPSVRWRHCTHHCVQVLSARALTLMCHSNLIQHHIVTDGHLKILVDALDPNHDPVSTFA